MKRKRRTAMALLAMVVWMPGCGGDDGGNGGSDETRFQPTVQVKLADSSGGTIPVAMAQDGSFLASWCIPVPDYCTLRAQRFGANGAKVGAEYAQVDGSTSSVAIGQDGSGFVAWNDFADAISPGSYVRAFGADGNARGGATRLSTFPSNQGPVVAAGTGGETLVVRTQCSPGCNGYAVLAQRLALDGSKLGAEFPILSLTREFFGPVRVGIGPSGSFVVAWENSFQRPDRQVEVLIQRFASDGTKLGEPIQTSFSGEGPGGGRHWGFSAGAHGEFVLVWAPRQQSIVVQRYAPDGTKQGPEIEVSAAAGIYVNNPAIAIGPDGRMLVTWNNGAASFQSSRVLGQMLAADGTKLGTELAISDGIAPQALDYVSACAAGGEGRFIVTWNRPESESVSAWARLVEKAP